jgi:hypothetical protein
MYHADLRYEHNSPQRSTPQCAKGTAASFVSQPILIDAQAIDFNPLSYRGYQLEHELFYGARHYSKAIAAFGIMLSKLENAANIHTRSEP